LHSHRTQPESPDAFDRPGLAARLGLVIVRFAHEDFGLRCLHRPGRVERVAPFIPTRTDCRISRHGRE